MKALRLFLVKEVSSGTPLRMSWMPREPTTIREVERAVPPLQPPRSLNQSCLSTEPSIKNQMIGSESLSWCVHGGAGRQVHPEVREALPLPPHTWLPATLPSGCS